MALLNGLFLQELSKLAEDKGLSLSTLGSIGDDIHLGVLLDLLELVHQEVAQAVMDLVSLLKLRQHLLRLSLKLAVVLGLLVALADLFEGSLLDFSQSIVDRQQGVGVAADTIMPVHLYVPLKLVIGPLEDGLLSSPPSALSIGLLNTQLVFVRLNIELLVVVLLFAVLIAVLVTVDLLDAKAILG